MTPYADHHAPIDRRLDLPAIALWNAAQARTRVAYEDIKARAAVPPTRRKR